MGRGVLINKEKAFKSGPIELIVGGVLQPGYERYINKPTVSVSVNVWQGVVSKRGSTYFEAKSTEGGTDTSALEGSLDGYVRVDFTTRALGKTVIIKSAAETSARFYNNGGVYLRALTNNYIWRNWPCGHGGAEVRTREDQFEVTQENFYITVRAMWDGWTSIWRPLISASIVYLAII